MRHSPPTWPRDEVAALVAELVRRPSPSGKEAAVAAYIAAWLRDAGIAADLVDTAPGRPNVTAEVSRGTSGRSLLFFGHTDTALPTEGWLTDPYAPQHRDGRLVGLGAQDMKGGVAAAMLALRELARRDTWEGTVRFAAVIDEEAYSLGMKGLLKMLPHTDWALLGEPHYDDVVLGCPGKVLVKIHVQGKAAHGSTPHLGINAISEAAWLLTAIEDLALGTDPRLGRGTQCVLNIHGGPDAYVITVPEHCAFALNRHIVPGETGQQVLSQIEALVKDLRLRARVEATIEEPYYPPYVVEREDPFVETFGRVYEAVRGRPPQWGYGHGVCDANYLVADAGVPTVVFGPRGGNLHSPNEWVDLASVADVAAVYVMTAERMLRSRLGNVPGMEHLEPR